MLTLSPYSSLLHWHVAAKSRIAGVPEDLRSGITQIGSSEEGVCLQTKLKVNAGINELRDFPFLEVWGGYGY